jgi:protein gp37
MEIMTGFTRWSPFCGCTPVNDGCDNCPGERAAWLIRKRTKDLETWEACAPTIEDKKWTGDVSFFPDRLDQPLHWRKPRRVLVMKFKNTAARERIQSLIKASHIDHCARRHVYSDGGYECHVEGKGDGLPADFPRFHKLMGYGE